MNDKQPTPRSKRDSFEEPSPEAAEGSSAPPLVAIGAAASGLEAFKGFFEAMPADSGAAFVVVQHLDPAHHSEMISILSRYTDMPVADAEDGVAVEPNHVYILPPNRLIWMQEGAFVLKEPGGSGERGSVSSRASIDLFFRSVAEDRDSGTVATFMDVTDMQRTRLDLAAQVAQQAAAAELGRRALAGEGRVALFQHASELLCKGLSADCCGVFLARPDQPLLLEIGMGWEPDVVGEAEVDAGRSSPQGLSMHTHGPVLIEDLARDDRFPGAGLLRDHRLVSGINVTVSSEEKAYGVLGAYSRTKRRFTGNDISFVNSLGHVMGQALRRYQSEQQLKSLNDSLETRVTERTELAERRAEELRHLASELVLVEERERRQIAADLHDDLSQNLVVIKLKLASLRKMDDPDQRARVNKEVQGLIDRVTASARSLTAQLSPPILYELGLAPALQWLGEEMHRLFGLSVEVDNQAGGSIDIDERVRFVLFRSVRELLVNAAKHANVPDASIRLTRSDTTLSIMVQDDGDGFDHEAVGDRSTHAGFGLFSIRERLGYLGGSMDIQSHHPNDGTVITLTAPLADHTDTA